VSEPTPMTLELRDIADFMADYGFGRGDTEDAPKVRAAADEIDRLRNDLARVTAQRDRLCELIAKYSIYAQGGGCAPFGATAEEAAALLARTSQAPAAPEGERG
jgi:hypothetical protein